MCMTETSRLLNLWSVCKNINRTWSYRKGVIQFVLRQCNLIHPLYRYPSYRYIYIYIYIYKLNCGGWFYAVKELLILICKLTNWFCFDSRVMCIWIAWLDPFQVFSLEKIFHYIWHVSLLSTPYICLIISQHLVIYSFTSSCLLISFLNLVFALQPLGEIGRASCRERV